MKLTCPACSAQYTVADERLDGRRVKVRCKRCGESFPVEPSPRVRRGHDADLFAGAATAGAEDPVSSVSSVATSAPPLTGERHESSVLFSLAALAKQAPAPPPSRTTESSALIDIRALVSASATTPKGEAAPRADDIAHLSGGGAFAELFAPPLAPPVTWPDSDAAPASGEATRRRRTRLVISAMTAVALAGALVFAGLSRSRAPVASALPAATALAAPAALPSVAATEPSITPAVVATSETPPASVAPPRVAAPARSAAHASDTKTVAAPATVTTTASAPPKCCAGESEIACQMRVSAGAACSAEPPSSKVTSTQPFDRPAAARALGINVSSCKRGDGPTGPGHAKVTFQPSGSVSAVDVEAPYAGTATGACVAQRFRGASVPSFAGGPLTVGKGFAIE